MFSSKMPHYRTITSIDNRAKKQVHYTSIINRVKRQAYHYKYQEKSQETETSPQILKLSLVILVLSVYCKLLTNKDHASSKNNDGNEFKTYVYRQITPPTQFSIENKA